MMLFGWSPTIQGPSAAAVLPGMAAALRVHRRQKVSFWIEEGLALGAFLPPEIDREAAYFVGPVESADRRYALWMVGEAFAWNGRSVAAGPLADGDLNRALLASLLQAGADAIRELDGEYHIALWDRERKVLSLYVDRFAALPLYWTENAEGFAFAGGVRGVLMAPAVECRPDPRAIREAVSFGGFRLGSRTNVAGVHMAPPAAAITRCPRQVDVRRYWSWSEAPEPIEMPVARRLEETRDAWQRAITTRLQGSGRPGVLLSGGLDSRAILGEVSRQTAVAVSAVTYGSKRCDDARFARRAAATAGAEWRLFPLYEDGWLERRLAHVHATDGLMDLVDLMHTEVLPQLPDHMDVYLSGYIGDLVSGSTYLRGTSAEDVLAAMPYYGGRLGLGAAEAKTLAQEILACTPGGGHFATYDHKLPQSTNRITAAARPWVRVRRPFVDYHFWSQAYRVPADIRQEHGWHEHWLRSTYPALFARIPNQRTGVPAGSSRARYHLTRIARYGARQVRSLCADAGLPVTVPERGFHADWPAWRRPDVRRRLTETIMRRDSIVVDVFGRDQVAATLRDYFEHDAAPTQVVGAMFAFEHYHQTLPSMLREWAAHARHAQ